MQSTPASARCRAGPIPDRRSSVGESSAPALTMTRDPRTCSSRPSRANSTPTARPSSSTIARHLGVGPDREVLPLAGERQVAQCGRHANAVAPVHRHRADPRGVRRVEVVDPGDAVVGDRREERLLGRHELVTAPAHDGNRAARAVGVAGEVVVGLQAAEHPEHVRPRPFVPGGGGPTLVVVADAAHREPAVDCRAATGLPAHRVVEAGARDEVGVDAPLRERPREPHLVGEPVRIRDPEMIGPGLDQQHPPSVVFAQPRRERDAGRAASHDDVVVLGHVTPASTTAARSRRSRWSGEIVPNMRPPAVRSFSEVSGPTCEAGARSFPPKQPARQCPAFGRGDVVAGACARFSSRSAGASDAGRDEETGTPRSRVPDRCRTRRARCPSSSGSSTSSTPTSNDRSERRELRSFRYSEGFVDLLHQQSHADHQECDAEIAEERPRAMCRRRRRHRVLVGVCHARRVTRPPRRTTAEVVPLHLPGVRATTAVVVDSSTSRVPTWIAMHTEAKRTRVQ